MALLLLLLSLFFFLFLFLLLIIIIIIIIIFMIITTFNMQHRPLPVAYFSDMFVIAASMTATCRPTFPYRRK